jgi:hypothetical protein
MSTLNSDIINASYILGPQTLTFHQKGDIKIYVFGELHVPYKSNEYKCNDDSIRTPEFLKNLIEKTTVPIDFFIEKQIQLVNKKPGGYGEASVTHVSKMYKEPYDIDKIRFLIYDCARLINKNCKYNLLRVHSVDLRVEDGSIPTFNVILEDGIQRLRKQIKRINNGENVIFNKILKQIFMIDDIHIRNVLIEEYKYCIRLYNLFISPINDFPELSILDDDKKQDYIHSLELINNLCKKEDRKQRDKLNEIIHKYETLNQKYRQQYPLILKYFESPKLKDVNNMKDVYDYLEILFSQIHMRQVRSITIIEDYFYRMVKPTFELNDRIEILQYLKELGNRDLLPKMIGALKRTISIPVMDLYTVARMMRKFKHKPGVYSKPPKNIIYYGGDHHSNNIRKLLDSLGFSRTDLTAFDSIPEIKDKLKPKCIDISRFKYYHEFFDNKNL